MVEWCWYHIPRPLAKKNRVILKLPEYGRDGIGWCWHMTLYHIPLPEHETVVTEYGRDGIGRMVLVTGI